MSDYLNQLNSVQRKSAESLEGPVIIIAGAGSGKTRVLTYRIAHLIRSGVSPFNILALTFTNKAAKEMKARVVDITGGADSRNIWIGTFHSVFARILRIESDKLGYPANFTIYDTIDSKSQIKSIIKEKGLDDKVYKPGLVMNRISLAKNNLITPDVYTVDANIQKEDQLSAKPELGAIYQTYVKRCFKAGAMDFDDLLCNMNYLLNEFPDALHKYQHQFQYVLIDEFQDTNLLQYAIVKKLAALHENICVVGDDAQSIYAFRGANIQNILNFKRDYPDLETHKLEQNYRSTQNIVKAANCVIGNNKQQLHKQVWTENPEGESITVFRALTDNEEGIQVAQSIFERKVNAQLNNIDFAILYRTNAQSRAMEEALRKLNIPYRIYGGLSFYQRKEIKDVIAYFRLAVNNNDEEALKRVINYPARGIGTRSFEKIIIAANDSGQSPWQIISDLSAYNLGIGAGAAQKIFDFVSMIKSFSAELGTKNAYDLGSLIASSSGIVKDLYDNQTPEGLSRYENIQELLNGLKEFSDKWVNNNGSENETDLQLPRLSEYLQDIALFTDADKDDPNDRDKVSLMTIHSAKGLEFPVVYIVGMEENLFPSQLSLNSREDLEEERRLFYVALTRAREKVFLSFANTRYRWGSVVHCEPSRFIDEIDNKYLEFPGALRSRNTFENTEIPGWDFRKKQKQSKKGKKSEFPKVTPVKKNLINIRTAINSNEVEFNGDDTSDIQVGMQVEHQRFGTGKVLQIEGAQANQKATVYFDSAGQKQLLLKFAKLKILSS